MRISLSTKASPRSKVSDQSGLATLLLLEGDIDVVAEAETGTAALAAEIAAGGRYIDANISAQALVDDCPLTDRERDVLRVTSEGYSVRHMAQILHLAEGTVRNYLSAAIGKTHTSTRHDAARYARQKGWL